MDGFEETTEDNPDWSRRKVAIIHDWLVTDRGGERVLEQCLKLFPHADVYTLFYEPKQSFPWLKTHRLIYPRSLNALRRLRKALLPILPFYIEAIELSEYDLVLSSSSCVAKGVIPSPEALHVCYIHSPMRYIWDQRSAYLPQVKSFNQALQALFNLLLTPLRVWDIVSSTRVDAFVANSRYVARRVELYYRRSADVIAPPVAVEALTKRPQKQSKLTSEGEGYVVVAGAFVPYKRMDLAIQACERCRLKLVVIGSGPSEAYLRKLAGEQTTVIAGANNQDFLDVIAGARLMVMPWVEDFGIVPVEALALGVPVLAYHGGGALDYVQPGVNGEVFTDLTVEGLQSAIEKTLQTGFDKARIRETAEAFGAAEFRKRMLNHINARYRAKWSLKSEKTEPRSVGR